MAKESINAGPFTFWTYLLALGPTAFLFWLGLLTKEKSRTVSLLLSWIISALVWAFFLSKPFNINPTRFLQQPIYIPMAILTMMGIGRLIKNKAVVLCLALALVFIGLPANFISLRNQYKMYADYSSLIYPEDFLVDAFNFLERETKPNEPVLAFYMAGNLIPFLAGNGVYLGQIQGTINYQAKVTQANTFFSGLLNADQANEFLQQNHLELIFFGPQEKSAGGSDKIQKYPFLVRIFDNGKVTIFKVKL